RPRTASPRPPRGGPVRSRRCCACPARSVPRCRNRRTDRPGAPAGFRPEGRSPTGGRPPPRCVAAPGTWPTGWNRAGAPHSARCRHPIRHARPPRCAALLASSSCFCDLRSAFQRFQPGAARRRLCVLTGAGKVQREQVPGRTGLLATDHHDIAEDALHVDTGLLGGQRLTGEHPAQEPAGPVHSQEPRRPVALAPVREPNRQPGQQLLAEDPGLDARRAALFADLGLQLLAQPVPESFGAWRREGLQLQGRTVQAQVHRHHAARLLVHFHAYLQAGAFRDPQSPQVHPVAQFRFFGDVPRADQVLVRLVLWLRGLFLWRLPGRLRIGSRVGGLGGALTAEQRHQRRPSLAASPVDPNPPAPPTLPGSCATSITRAGATRCATRWAMRAPRSRLAVARVSVFTTITSISPRYPASTVPGALSTVTPCRDASPERGCTRPAYPS